jgi:S1-C subfamily serine protease
MRIRTPLIIATVSLISLALQPGIWINKAESSTQLDSETRENIRRVIPSVGIIFARNSSEPPGQFPRLRGSGVIIRADGIVVTNYHVIRHDDDDQLYDELTFGLPSSASTPGSDNYRFRLELLVTSKQHDLALLKIAYDRKGGAVPSTTRFPAIEFGDSRGLKLMDDLIIIGYPGKAGSDVTVNKGLVEGIDTVNEWIKTDARLMRGNSGGAAVNREGRLIGIPSKVIVDTQPVGKESAEGSKPPGAIGYLRPSYLVAAMLGRIGGAASIEGREKPSKNQASLPDESRPQVKVAGPKFLVRGRVVSASNGKPVAGARIGVVPLGTGTVTAENLIAWGGTDADGQFELKDRVPAGRYSLRVVAFGYSPLMIDVEIQETTSRLLLQMRPGK